MVHVEAKDDMTATACSLSTVSKRTNDSDFAKLFNVYQYFDSTCGLNSDIVFARTRMLTNEVCLKLTGNSNSI
jgi:hypothetical protein